MRRSSVVGRERKSTAAAAKAPRSIAVERPLVFSITISPVPAVRVRSTGIPTDIASAQLSENPSRSEGRSSASADW